jgi:hypothetical protein
VVGPARAFFVSYTGADQAWAEWIADQLEAAGHPVVLQAWDFRPGENFLLRMNQALEQAERVLAVLSAAYFGSAYATDEWTAALVRDPAGRDRLLPVRIAPCELPPLIANRVYVDLVGLDEEAAAGKLLAGVVRGRAKPPGRRPSPARRSEGRAGRGSRVAAPRSSTRRRATPTSPAAATCSSSCGAPCGPGGWVRWCRPAPPTGWVGWARPSWRSSTPTGTPPTTTSSGGSPPSSQSPSPAGWPPWPAASACPSPPMSASSSGCCLPSWAGGTAGCLSSTTPPPPTTWPPTGPRPAAGTC